MITTSQTQTNNMANTMKNAKSSVRYETALENLSRFAERYTENTVYKMIEEINNQRPREEIPSVKKAGVALSKLSAQIQNNINNLKHPLKLE